MAAPSPVARQTPTGIPLADGFSTLITVNANPDISFWEKDVTPPGLDGGDPIETTTMHQTKWRTFFPRQLQTLTPVTTTVAYDPNVFAELTAILNINQVFTVTHPDGSTVAFWGMLQTYEPGTNAEGEQPEATITITPTNMDENLVEQAPVYNDVPGT